MIARKGAGKTLAGLWEFPGGKVEDGEDLFVALKREIIEELGMEIQQLAPAFDYKFDYPDLKIHFYFIHATSNQEPLHLIDHDAVAWITKEEISAYHFAPGDIQACQHLYGKTCTNRSPESEN